MADIIDMQNKFKHLKILNHIKRIIADTDYADYVSAVPYPDNRTESGMGVAIVTADGGSKLLDLREYDIDKIYPKNV